MEKIKKGYSVKIISIVVIMCFLITSLAYPDTIPKKYCLRLQLDFNSQERATVIARYNQALRDYVEYKISLRNRAKNAVASLRPTIEEGHNLTAQEFEKHISRLANMLEYPYDGVKRIGYSNIFISIREDFSSLSLYSVILEAISFIVIPSTDGYRIKMPGSTAFILPLIYAIIGIIRLGQYTWNIGNFVYIIILTNFVSLWLLSSAVNFLGYYKTDNASLRHELKHVYVNLILQKLKEERLLDLSLEDAIALLPSDDGFPIISREKINTEELKKVEDVIINSLFPEPGSDRYKNELPESDIPADTESENRVRKIRALYEQL